LVLLQAGIVAKTEGGNMDSLQKNKAQNTVSTDFCTPTKRPASKGPGIKGPTTKDPEEKVRIHYYFKKKNLFFLYNGCVARRKTFLTFLTTSWVSMNEFAFLKRY
jgi:hypothetical protein